MVMLRGIRMLRIPMIAAAIAVMLLGVAQPSPAFATPVTGTISGHVTGQSGALTLFGGNVVGQSYTALWSYDLTGYTLSSVNSGTNNFAHGNIANGIEIEITIAGHTFTSISTATYQSDVVIQPGDQLWIATADFCSSCNATRLILNSSQNSSGQTLLKTTAFGSSSITSAVFNSALDGSPGQGNLNLSVDVPEPASLALFGIGVGALLRLRKRSNLPV